MRKSFLLDEQEAHVSSLVSCFVPFMVYLRDQGCKPVGNHGLCHLSSMIKVVFLFNDHATFPLTCPAYFFFDVM